MINGNFRLPNVFSRLSRNKGVGRLRCGDHVRRRQARYGQAETGKVVQANRFGVRRIRVHWTDDTDSNVKRSSLTRINIQRGMGYSDHDPDLRVWGVAEEDPADGTLRVRAYRSHDDADRAAALAPQLVVEGQHPTTGAPCRIPGVSPLVWHHSTEGWTLAAVGWSLSDARRA